MVSEYESFSLNKEYFLAKKGFLVIRNLFFFWDMFLNSSQIFSQRAEVFQWVEFSGFENII